MSRTIAQTIEIISQEVRLLTACLEIEEGSIHLALANQKAALEWVLELVGAEPADAPVAPRFEEPHYSLAEFRDYCARHEVTAGEVEVVFLQWLYSSDNTLYGATTSDPTNTSSFVIDSIVEQGHDSTPMVPRKSNGAFGCD